MFGGTLSRGAYAVRSAARVLILVAVTIAFPFVLHLMLKKSGCGGGACGALAVVVPIFAKPAIYIVFVLSFIGITMRRLRDAGLSVWLVVVLPILFLADLGFILLIGTPWVAGFGLFSMAPVVPKFMLTALACIVFLSVLPSSDGRTDERNWGPAGIVALCLLLVITAFALVTSVIPMFAAYAGGMKMLKTYTSMMPLLIPVARAFPYMIAMLAALLSIVAWQQRTNAQLRNA